MLNQINEIYYCPASAFDETDKTVWQRVRGLQTPAKLDTTTKRDGVRLTTHKLTFKACARLDTSRPIAFRLKALGGGTVFIGSRERPYPTIQVQQTHPDSPNGTTLYQYTVERTEEA